MKIHDLKCWPAPWQATERDWKTHEVRQDDRGFEEGHVLLLREWDPGSKAYTGRQLMRRVQYVSRGPDWGLPHDMVVMSLGAV